MTTDLATLATAAEKAQAAVEAERQRQAAADAKATEKRRLRSIAWAWSFIVEYSTAQGAAGERVSALLASLTAAITVDLAEAARLYLDAVREMAKANRLGEDLVKARAILQAAGELPGVHRVGRDPVGDNAPYAIDHGMVRFPTFIEFVSEALDKQRAAASRVQSSEAPEAFEGTASEGLRAEALRREFVLTQELENLLAIREQHPERFAQLPDAERASVNAYARQRELVGYAEPLPKIVVEGRRETEPPAFAPDDATRIRLYGPDHTPGHRS